MPWAAGSHVGQVAPAPLFLWQRTERLGSQISTESRVTKRLPQRIATGVRSLAEGYTLDALLLNEWDVRGPDAKGFE